MFPCTPGFVLLSSFFLPLPLPHSLRPIKRNWKKKTKSCQKEGAGRPPGPAWSTTFFVAKHQDIIVFEIPDCNESCNHPCGNLRACCRLRFREQPRSSRRRGELWSCFLLLGFEQRFVPGCCALREKTCVSLTERTHPVLEPFHFVCVCVCVCVIFSVRTHVQRVARVVQHDFCRERLRRSLRYFQEQRRLHLGA